MQKREEPNRENAKEMNFAGRMFAPPHQNRWRGVFHINRKPQSPWSKATIAALSIGIPFVIGGFLGQLQWALLAGIGGYTSLYVHNESYKQRAVKLLWVNLGLTVSFGLGLITAASPWAMALAIGGVSAASTFLCGVFRVPPPAGFFFVLVCAVGTGLPVDLSATPLRMGIAFLGGCLAWVIAMSGWLLGSGYRGTNETQVTNRGARHEFRSAFDLHSPIWATSLRNGIAVLFATLLAFAFGIERPYWVPLSCASVLRGATMLDVVNRTIQRSIGTAVGVIIAGGIFIMQPSIWMLGLYVMILQFVTELIIVRNYAFAVIFITPLALIIAETGRADMTISTLIGSRLLDTLLGCAIGAAAALLYWKHPVSE
ncbi:FUSC family protein [Brevibacillus massiliensis]|uniref:FUSC family protein n=1 Tax=Brevibacillus massiliensis TaxID=1118054 RepID=UPI00037BF50F|nr:FUSC family protein [Brevibacillus massiliensis]